MKKIISKLIYAVVLSLSLYLLVANIFHIIYINRYETYNFDNKTISDIKENIKSLDEKINKINSMTSMIYSSEELETIKETLNENMETIKNNKLLTYKGSVKFNDNELFELENETSIKILSNINMFEKIKHHDIKLSNYSDYYKANYVATAFNNEGTYQQLINNYKYQTKDVFNSNIIEVENSIILSMIYRLNAQVSELNMITTLILEVGGNNND